MSVNFNPGSPAYSESSSAFGEDFGPDKILEDLLGSLEIEGDQKDPEIAELQQTKNASCEDYYRPSTSAYRSLSSRIDDAEDGSGFRTPTGSPREFTPLSSSTSPLPRLFQAAAASTSQGEDERFSTPINSPKNVTFSTPTATPIDGKVSPTQQVRLKEVVSRALKRRREDIESGDENQCPQAPRKKCPPAPKKKTARIINLDDSHSDDENKIISPFIINANEFRKTCVPVNGIDDQYFLKNFALTRFNQGQHKDVYAFVDERHSNLLVKFYSDELIREKANLVAQNYPMHGLKQYRKCVELDIPVAKICNEATVLEDGYFVVERIPYKLRLHRKWIEDPNFKFEDLDQLEKDILTKVRALFTFAVRYNLEQKDDFKYLPLALDLQPENLMSDGERIVLVDFMETDDEDEAPLVQIKQGLKSWVGQNKNIYTFLVEEIRQIYPQYVDMWGLNQFEE